MIKYEYAPEIKSKVLQICSKLDFKHVDMNRVACFRSFGSSSTNTIARCHALSTIWQKTLNTKAHYIIEVLSEKYDSLSEDEKDKTLIHELMHVPKSFGGGFRHHDYVCDKNVTKLHKIYKNSN